MGPGVGSTDGATAAGAGADSRTAVAMTSDPIPLARAPTMAIASTAASPTGMYRLARRGFARTVGLSAWAGTATGSV